MVEIVLTCSKIVPLSYSLLLFATHVCDLHAALLKLVDMLDKRQCSSILKRVLLGSVFEMRRSCWVSTWHSYGLCTTLATRRYIRGSNSHSTQHTLQSLVSFLVGKSYKSYKLNWFTLVEGTQCRRGVRLSYGSTATLYGMLDESN